MKKQSVSNGFTILTLGSLIVKIPSLLYLIILTLIIGQEGFGVYSAVYTIYIFIYIVTNSGMSVATAKLLSELAAKGRHNDITRSFKLILLLMAIVGLTMSLLMCFYALPLSKAIKFPKAYIAVRALAPAIFFTSILSVYRGYFQASGNMVPTTISQIIEQFINVASSLLFAYLLMKYGIEAACAGATVGTSLGAFAAIIYLIHVYKKDKTSNINEEKPQFKYKNVSTKDLLNKIFKYAIPITICLGMQNAGSLIDMINVKDRLIVAGFSDSIASSLFGIIGQFNTLINVPITIISALSVALLPSISASNILGEKNEIKRKILYSFRLCFIIAIPSAIGFSVLGKPIYTMLFPITIEGYKFMAFGSIIVVLWSIVLIQTAILQGIGKLYIATTYILFGIILKVFINYNVVSIRNINIYGALLGNISYFIIPLVLNQLLLVKTLKVKLSLFKISLKPLISALFMGIIIYPSQYIMFRFFRLVCNTYLSNALSTLLSIILGGFIYVYILALTKGIDKDDLQLIPSQITKRIPSVILKKIKNSNYIVK
ncbi:polysaccharide biosynthesis protein [Clostridium estertheticum]|uniref:putative polysaccharide biosynthesis protein n=1 Tax=Clostridium estertheticum TaxID=238834 RepID=UPI001C6EFEDC|nr:polysaccharide biosynthesis protein [Clostridium estertheticum]MBW9172532.1 polysaccharide biosynthesis protein [Clostridium estertheticum]WLC76513.1 polysaccharide biosynthesis protein [Clostridium estertheticum]